MNNLILGDGLLGSELKKQTNWDIASRKKSNLDLNNLRLIEDLIINYKCVVNCVANTNTYSDNKKTHFDINYRFPMNLSNICQKLNIKLVHISTEFVYANNIKSPNEDDLPLPAKNWYAYSKLLADEYISLTNKNHLICRLLHKPNPFPYDKVWDVVTCGDMVDKISFLVIKLIEKKAFGIWNVGTGKKKLISLAPNKSTIIKPDHVPYDTSMDLSKLNKFLSDENINI